MEWMRVYALVSTPLLTSLRGPGVSDTSVPYLGTRHWALRLLQSKSKQDSWEKWLILGLG